MIFIDLEKANDNILREILWWAVIRKGILKKYICIMQDMYREVKIKVKTCGGATEDFLITFDLH